MPINLLEPVEAGIIVALISRLIINNPKFWECVQCSPSDKPEEHEPEVEDNSSNTTTVNGDLGHIQHFDPWMHT